MPFRYPLLLICRTIFPPDDAASLCSLAPSPEGLTSEAARLSVVHRKGWQTTTKSECRARTGFPTPAYASNVSCDSKDGVRAGIEAKRNLVTSRQRRVTNYLQTDGQTSLTAVSRPSMIFAGIFYYFCTYKKAEPYFSLILLSTNFFLFDEIIKPIRYKQFIHRINKIIFGDSAYI